MTTTPVTRAKATNPRKTKAPSLAKSREAQMAKRMQHLHEQMSLIHGVMEELCERQEAMSLWHMEFAKKVLRHLDPRLKRLMTDDFERVSEFMEELSADLKSRRTVREEFFKGTGLTEEDWIDFESEVPETLENSVIIQNDDTKSEIH